MKLLLNFQSLFRMNSILLFFLLGVNINSQNLISNPDFSDVTVEYNKGKNVFPNNWESINWPFPTFDHPAKRVTSDFFNQPSKQKSGGIIGLRILRPSETIFTKLNSKLSAGQQYRIYIKLRIYQILLNSNLPILATDMNHKKVDSLDYNCVVSLITTFHDSVPDCDLRENDHLLFIDFPKEDQQNQEWLTLTSSYVAKGDETYFSIGACSTQNYIDMLRKYKSDTISYEHRFAHYLLSNISIFPFDENTESDTKYLNHKD